MAKRIDDNLILMTDMYKHTHWHLIPKTVAYTSCYFEARGTRDKGVAREILNVGLRYYLERYLSGSVIKQTDIVEADALLQECFAANYMNHAGWQTIVDEFEGKLPILIRALPEGIVAPIGVPVFTIENTDPRFPWLPTFLETLLMKVWYPISVASTSMGIYKLLNKYAEESSDTGFLRFHLNDFGARGVSSEESAGIGGMAHLTVFHGSDNIQGARYAKFYYDATRTLASVPATEHSETLLYGVGAGEQLSYEAAIKAFPNGILSVVTDTYNHMNAVTNIIGKSLKYQILKREGKFVVRPDSGYPPQMALETVQALYEAFGGTKNSKGFIVLNPKVGVIYGDFMSYGMIMDVCEALLIHGFSIDNIVFGMGGRLLQEVSRDTYMVAIKNSAYATVKNNWIGISKNPSTDNTKRSKAGYFQVIRNDKNQLECIQAEWTKEDKNLLKPVFKNGEILIADNFDTICARVSEELNVR